VRVGGGARIRAGVMKQKRRASIRGLIRKLTFSLGLTILGSWGLLLTRLQSVINSDLALDLALFEDDLNLYIDLGSLSLVFLGLLMSWYYRRLLKPRLDRLDELGEGSW